MTTKEKELFEKKVTIKDWLVIKLCNILNLPKNYTGTIVCMDFNTPKVMKLVKAYFHQARVIFMEQVNFEKLFGISGLYYKDEGERIDMLKSIEGNLIIIANPPYGAIGANIAYTIREKVDYECFVNLLPANDYKRNKTKDLFNYQSEMEPVNDGFDDAAVTTHLCLVSKNKVNNMTLDEFERSQYIDPSLDKYFEENSKRNHYAIDKSSELQNIKNPDLTKIIFIGSRDINHKHLPYSKNTLTNNINLNLLSYKEICEKFCMKSAKEKGELYFQGNCFVLNTQKEKDNIINLVYSKDGFRFISKLFTSMNVDGRTPLYKVFPKVDWTRPWTVEEILKDYGYTEDEIKTVMADLDNFKGMDD